LNNFLSTCKTLCGLRKNGKLSKKHFLVTKRFRGPPPWVDWQYKQERRRDIRPERTVCLLAQEMGSSNNFRSRLQDEIFENHCIDDFKISNAKTMFKLSFLSKRMIIYNVPTTPCAGTWKNGCFVHDQKIIS